MEGERLGEKGAILLYRYRLRPVEKMEEGRFCGQSAAKGFTCSAKPHSPLLFGAQRFAHIAPKVVIMAPSFVNISAYVD